MIQRVQTLFLLAASGLLFSLFFCKFTYNADIVIKYNEYLPFFIFTIITSGVSICSIFIFKDRMMQMRLCIYNMLILLAYQGWIIYKIFNRIEGTTFSTTAVFPIVAGILTFLALRYIGRDEATVQAANSIRRSAKRAAKRRS